MARSQNRRYRIIPFCLGAWAIASVGCFSSGKKDAALPIQPEAKSILKQSASTTLPAPQFTPKETGGTGVNVRDSFGRTTPRTSMDVKPLSMAATPETTNEKPVSSSGIVPVSHSVKREILDAPMTAREQPTMGIVPDVAPPVMPMNLAPPTPKLDLPLDGPFPQPLPPTGSPGKGLPAIIPLSPPTMPPVPMGMQDLPKPTPITLETETRMPALPLPGASDMPGAAPAVLPKLPSATDGPIPGAKPSALPPADPIRPN